MPIDMSKVNLDAPAFGPGSEVNNKVNDQPSETVIAEAPQAENDTAPVLATDDKSTVSEDDEQKVPYSRMKSVIEARREAERRAADAEDELARIRSERNVRSSERDEVRTSEYDGNLPSYWVAMYGDNETSRKAFGYELERQKIVKDEARREAIEAVRQERYAESQAVTANESVIDNRLEDLSLSLGRDLSVNEENDLLDIIDEYTPKDADGNYAGDLIPFEKAWEIYELKQAQTSNRATRRRSTATDLTSARSEGEPSDKERINKDWNPLDWNSYKRRIPN